MTKVIRYICDICGFGTDMFKTNTEHVVPTYCVGLGQHQNFDGVCVIPEKQDGRALVRFGSKLDACQSCRTSISDAMERVIAELGESKA